jgi:hypothetical protein
MTCAIQMGDAEAYARQKRFKEGDSGKARTLLEIEIQLRRELSAEVRKYLAAAYKRLMRGRLGCDGLLVSGDAETLAEILQGLRDGRPVEEVIERRRLSLSEEYARGIPAEFGV